MIKFADGFHAESSEILKNNHMTEEKIQVNVKERSKLSDEELARLIEEDCRRNPSDYSFQEPISSDSIPGSKYFFTNASAMGIEPIRKWL